MSDSNSTTDRKPRSDDSSVELDTAAQGPREVPEEESGSELASRKRKGRQKAVKRRRARHDSTDGPALDEQGRERPWFLNSFPDDPELLELSRAFESGNYAFVKEHAPKVAERAQSDAVKKAALELAERIKPDPLMKYILLGSALLLLYLVAHAYMSHGH